MSAGQTRGRLLLAGCLKMRKSTSGWRAEQQQWQKTKLK